MLCILFCAELSRSVCCRIFYVDQSKGSKFRMLPAHAPVELIP